MEDKITIILPTYNIENYVDECIQSVLNQTYKNFELIIIDDGSTDHTLDKCKKFLNDKRIKIISQANQGVSKARNVGIENALGNFIAFIDGDDILSKKYLETLLNNTIRASADMAICQYVTDIDKLENRSTLVKNEILSKSNLETLIIKKQFQDCYVWNKLFKKSIIRDNNIKFPIGITIWEDIYFVFCYLEHCNEITIINQSLYYYRSRENSAVNQSETVKKTMDKLAVLNLLKKLKISNLDFTKQIVIHEINIKLSFLIKSRINNKEQLKIEIVKIRNQKKKYHLKLGLKNTIKYIYLLLKMIK